MLNTPLKPTVRPHSHSEQKLGHFVTEQIGSTPLLQLTRIVKLRAGVQLLAKAEWFNPGGSVKDRAALFIVEDAIARGQLGHGKALIDSTSGNTGIAYAMIGAAKGIPVEL